MCLESHVFYPFLVDMLCWSALVVQVCEMFISPMAPNCGTCCLSKFGSVAGKQSLARLAAFLCGYELFQIAVTSTYGLSEF